MANYWMFFGALVFLAVGWNIFQKKDKDPAIVKNFYQFGKFKLVSLLDGYNDFPLKNIVKDGTNFDHPLFHAPVDATMQVPINVFLVDIGDQNILFDVGFAGLYNSSTGKLPQALEYAGYTPEQITAICITHFHPDHIAGLLNSDGTKAFKYAELFIEKSEVDYWENATGPFTMSRYASIAPLVQKILKLYSVHKIVSGQKLFDGVTVVATPGHTPGHVSFLCESEAYKILVWGDLLHFPQVQFAHPEVSILNDSNRQQAIATRKSILQRAAQESFVIAGVHLTSPGVGTIQFDQSSTIEQPSYRWITMNPSCLE